MRNNIITLFCCSLMLAACGNQTQEKEDMNFVDNVKTALADSGRIDLKSLQWTREPRGFEIKGDTITVPCRAANMQPFI